MNEKKYKVEIPDLEYYQRVINCQYACPVKTAAGSYVTAITDREYEKAYDFARMPNPFVYVCGRICDHPCETACRRGAIDEPIAICALKRTATDHHNLSLGHWLGLPLEKKREEKVAVIGAGPAGLSAANDLARLGYQVTVFEASPVASGMLYLGLPGYRLPRDIIKLEVDSILNLGVELKTNTPLGEGLNLEDLKRQKYKAIFIATGCTKSRDLNIEGANLDGVLKGVDFLLNINLGYRVELGKRVIVIGGGNVAMDVARSAIRKGTELESLSPEEMKDALEKARKALQQLVESEEEREKEMHIAMDVARLALRKGAKDVHLVCLESREEMPAHAWETEEAFAEGIVFHNRLGPKRILGRDGKVTGIETIRCSSVFDSEHRFNPTFIKGTEEFIEADSIILAIGQAADISFFKKEDGISITRQGLIEVNPDTLATTADGIYAGGDIAFGPRNVIAAIADGQKAARSIDSYLRGESKKRIRARMAVIKDHKMHEGYERIKRQKMPTLPLNRRIGIAEVELGFSDEQAIEEGKRCLRCNINTVFDGNKCILCGGCVDICPEYCYRMAKIEELEENEVLEKLVEARYGISFEKLKSESGLNRAMIKDEEKCIRCGLCAERCPTGAITMELFEYSERI